VSTVPPIRRQITLDVDPETAFAVFTERLGQWWPLAVREAGYLVAAGPMVDAAGEGMTILRLPGSGQLGTATRLATEDDASVVAGLLAVTVRPWKVMMQAWPRAVTPR
jgi:hypothetical protein